VILKHEVAGVHPVVRDVAADVIAHHVGMARVIRPAQILVGHGDEAVHLPARYVAQEGGLVVRVVSVAVMVVDPRLSTASVTRVRQARTSGNAVRAGEGPEIGVERPVLLHDHDDVLDLVNAHVSL